MAGNCKNLTKGLDPVCGAIQKFGGLNKRVWIGQLSQLDSYTVNTNTLDIQSFSMALNGSISYTLKKFIGKKFKNNKTEEVQVGENVNTILQSVNLVLYHLTSKDKQAIEELINAEDVFVFAQNNADQIEVYGIDTESTGSDDPIGGLNCSAGSGGTGTVLNDPTAFTITLSGEHRILSRIFNTQVGATLQQNINYLDARSA